MVSSSSVVSTVLAQTNAMLGKTEFKALGTGILGNFLIVNSKHFE